MATTNDLPINDTLWASFFCWRVEPQTVGIQEIREIMGDDANEYTDKEIQEIREFVQSSARVVLWQYLKWG